MKQETFLKKKYQPSRMKTEDIAKILRALFILERLMLDIVL